ncbi:MAG: hypothetical protein JSW16_00705 [Dehalococcoidales bacterium]|nr:MAG: hypothetical protein JSW16_00705 [Dehalococcoidales bacterium]
MPESGLVQQIAQKGADHGEIADEVIRRPELLAEVLAGLASDKARIKYGCDKVLRRISERKPEILYPEIDLFIKLINSESTFLKWGAIHILANLAAVDSDGKIEQTFDKYFSPVTGPVLITAANIIKGAAVIALAKPDLTKRITAELLKVESARYQTAECNNIALGHTIRSFDRFYLQIKNKEPVNGLVSRHLENTRNATRKAAERFVKKRLA